MRNSTSQQDPVAAEVVRVAPGGHAPTVVIPVAASFRLRSDRAALTFRVLRKPEWASGIGRDRFGLLAEFTFSEVTQRLRWIPPGGFTRGSSHAEVGRFKDEEPQCEVVIGGGFWLFATPVTQALYEAVTGENPSRFEGPDRPVELVSWEDAHSFIKRINEQVPGLDLVLPSEAQWEYACRAGTRAATYAGDRPGDRLSDNSALDEIAWYGGNSGAETHPVGQKRPNGWGLYDMLGNVLEWCQDHWHDNYEGAPRDGSAWVDEGIEHSDRVVRGGSRVGVARFCRAAFRDGYQPEGRIVSVGFRPAKG